MTTKQSIWSFILVVIGLALLQFSLNLTLIEMIALLMGFYTFGLGISFMIEPKEPHSDIQESKTEN